MFMRLVKTIRNRGLLGTVCMVRNILLWRLFRLIRKRYAVARVHQFRMLLDLNDEGLSRELFVCRDRERTLGRILRTLLKPGMRVLDVGGNLGYYPLMEAVLVGQSGSVHVLEPCPANYELLTRNVELNARQDIIRPYMLAAFDSVGRQRFWLSRASNLGTMFPKTTDTGRALQLTGDTIEVETVDLSSFLRRIPPVDLIRMDTEGAEVPILRGLLPAVRSGLFGGSIVTEVHPSRYSAENDISSVLSELFSVGYQAEYLSSDDETMPSIRSRGYRPEAIIRESNTKCRGIYRTVRPDDVLTLVAESGAVRDLVLAKRL